jgi:hypothetical protein
VSIFGGKLNDDSSTIGCILAGIFHGKLTKSFGFEEAKIAFARRHRPSSCFHSGLDC